MRSIFTALLFLVGFTYQQASAQSHVACFQNTSDLSVQVTMNSTFTALILFFAIVSDDDFQMLNQMSNLSVTNEAFEAMVSAKDIQVEAYPEGVPNATQGFMHVSLNEKSMNFKDSDGKEYSFDYCLWD